MHIVRLKTVTGRTVLVTVCTVYSNRVGSALYVLFEYVHVDVPRRVGRLPCRNVGAVGNPVNFALRDVTFSRLSNAQFFDQRPFLALKEGDEFVARGRKVLEFARVPDEQCWRGSRPEGGNGDEEEETEEQKGGGRVHSLLQYICFMHENIVKPMNGRGSGGVHKGKEQPIPKSTDRSIPRTMLTHVRGIGDDEAVDKYLGLLPKHGA